MCESDNDGDFEENLLPSEIMELDVDINSSLIPGKSKKMYEKSYSKFMSWRTANKVESFSESVLLSYFQEMAKTFKASSLWTEFSKLKATLILNHQVNISNYSKLSAFLKAIGQGYKGKKSKTFLPHEIEEFLNRAPDQIYLPTKVALIFGIMGACRRQELHDLKFKNVKDLNSAILVNIKNARPRKDRSFTVQGKFYGLCKRYMELRPKNCDTPNFFLRYSNGQCLTQNVGINSFGNMGKTIAVFLNLPNPGSYTGHCFRRTSATLSIVASNDVVYLENKARWKYANEESIDSTTHDASTSRSLSKSMDCSTVNGDPSIQNAHASPDSSIENIELTNTEPRQLFISVKTERADNPQENDRFSDSGVNVYDSDESGSLQGDVVDVKMEHTSTTVVIEAEHDDSTDPEAMNPLETEDPIKSLDTQGKNTGTCPASHTQLLEAILSCVSRQERVAERTARAQEAQAQALNKIAALLERGQK